MAQTNINIRMDENLKRNMENTCRALGMNMTTAFTIFAAKMTREQRIPFEVSVDPFFSPINQAHLLKGAKAINEGKGISHELIEDYE